MKLTKTGYLIYLDAPRHLWAYANGKADKQVVDAFLMHLFDQGKEVQKLAREYIKNHLIAGNYHGEGKYRFEETKQDQDFEARIDFIVHDESDVWDLYEIKSSKRVKNQHISDLAFQYQVFQQHYKIGRAYILHLDGEYTRRGDLSLGQLFTRTDVTAEIEDVYDQVHSEKYEALDVLRTKDFKECPACVRPKACMSLALCHPELPDYPIYSIRHFSRKKGRATFLEENYSKNVLDVPGDAQLGEEYSFTSKQRDQIDVAQSSEPRIETEPLIRHLSRLEYPLHFLDYESFNPAVPMFDGYTPYDQMPFQYSLHIQLEEGGGLEHKEYIEMRKVDPSIGLLESLSAGIGDKGSVVIWSKFERTQNNDMSRRYPQYSGFLKALNERLWDLMEPFHQQWYNHPNFEGSYSIKKVLPVLVPALSYDELAIRDGAEAMIKWAQMVHGGGITAQYLGQDGDGVVDVPEGHASTDVEAELLEYCRMDTLAMVELLKQLRRFV